MDIVEYTQEEEDELHDFYFSVHAGQSEECLENINKIRHNDPTLTELYLESGNNYFDDMNWKLLGRYISRNTHLTCIDFTEMYPGPENIRNFFSDLPFGSLASVPLKDISIAYANLSTNIFDLMLKALSGGPIENISVYDSLIDSIEVLYEVKLPCLKHLDLSDNKILCTKGLETCAATLETLSMANNPITGCVGLSKLFEKGTALLEVSLCNTKVDDEGADMMASSLKHNNTVYLFEMENNNMTEKGCVSFLKLICDISSIENTLNSNHKIDNIVIHKWNSDSLVKAFLDSAVRRDGRTRDGRSKVIEFQLNSVKREALHCLQGIDYCYSSIFAEIDPLVLPDVLALVNREHGQTELYRMLANSASDLFSTVNRKVVLKQKLAEKNKEIANKKIEMASLTSQMAALSAEVSEINVELESIEEEEKEREQGKRTRDGRLKH